MSSANPSPQCDLSAGWTPFGSNCYKFKADARKTWNAARHDCVQEGGDLVSIVNTEEQQFLLGQLDNSMLDPWIGFSTLVRGNEKFILFFFYTIFLIISMKMSLFSSFRRVPRFLVKLLQETPSLNGLTQSQPLTQTGLLVNLRCKT